MSGQALEFKQLNIHAWEAFEKGQDIHMQAAPSQAELLFKNYKVIKEKLKSQMKETIMKKYMVMLQVVKNFQGSFSLDKVREKLNMIVQAELLKAWYVFTLLV